MFDRSDVRPAPTATSNPSPAGKQPEAYEAPALFPIGPAGELLQGSGRHKYDDTGRRGFVVG
jgi:hypothetical protein